jgi:Uncharacterized protein conserved in bacteria (DUF2213)
MRCFTDTELGPKQATLPSGALLCRDVTIARTGWQDYAAWEIGLDDPGMVKVHRDEADVFDEAAMASFESSPVTLAHPEDGVSPDTWRAYSVGHATNIRRDNDRLVADLIFYDRHAIDAIRSGQWRGVSCGYDAAYIQIGKGRYIQKDIRGNHVAVLPADQQPRCGPTCYIGDGMPIPNREGKVMARVRDQIRPDYGEDGSWTPMGADPTTAVGGELVQLLDNRFTYYISKDTATGRIGLFRHGTGEGMGTHYTEPSTLAMATADRMALMREMETAERDRMRGIAARNRDFWNSQNA